MEDPTHDSVINKSPSPESNLVAGGGSVSKRVRSKRDVFTGVEKELLVERYKGDKLNDKKSRQDVTDLISCDGLSLSVDQVKCWVDNFKTCLKLKKKTVQETESNDQK
jgi:hypothetical protein